MLTTSTEKPFTNKDDAHAAATSHFGLAAFQLKLEILENPETNYYSLCDNSELSKTLDFYRQDDGLLSDRNMKNLEALSPDRLQTRFRYNSYNDVYNDLEKYAIGLFTDFVAEKILIQLSQLEPLPDRFAPINLKHRVKIEELPLHEDDEEFHDANKSFYDTSNRFTSIQNPVLDNLEKHESKKMPPRSDLNFVSKGLNMTDKTYKRLDAAIPDYHYEAEDTTTRNFLRRVEKFRKFANENGSNDDEVFLIIETRLTDATSRAAEEAGAFEDLESFIEWLIESKQLDNTSEKARQNLF